MSGAIATEYAAHVAEVATASRSPARSPESPPPEPAAVARAAGVGAAAERGGRLRPAARPPRLRVLVTGGTRGIGRAIALRLARDGAERLVLGYMRNDPAGEEAAEEVRAAGAEPALVRGNVASERVIGELAAPGPYDVVVHNAATGVIRPAPEAEDKHWDWTLNANARAFLSLARTLASDMPP